MTKYPWIHSSLIIDFSIYRKLIYMKSLSNNFKRNRELEIQIKCTFQLNRFQLIMAATLKIPSKTV